MLYYGQCELNYQLNSSTFSLFSICINEIFLDDPFFIILVLNPICLIGSTTVPLKNTSPLPLQRKGKRLSLKSLCIWKE